MDKNLNEDITGLPVTERVNVRVLILAIITLSSVIAILFNTSSNKDKDTILRLQVELNTANNEISIIRREKDSIIQKDFYDKLLIYKQIEFIYNKQNEAKAKKTRQ